MSRILTRQPAAQWPSSSGLSLHCEPDQILDPGYLLYIAGQGQARPAHTPRSKQTASSRPMGPDRHALPITSRYAGPSHPMTRSKSRPGSQVRSKQTKRWASPIHLVHYPQLTVAIWALIVLFMPNGSCNLASFVGVRGWLSSLHARDLTLINNTLKYGVQLYP